MQDSCRPSAGCASLLLSSERARVSDSLRAESRTRIGHRAPYFVKILPDVVADGGVVVAGAIVSVTGRVYAMSDSVADAWVASGGIAEADRVLAVFAESFFEASVVTVSGR